MLVEQERAIKEYELNTEIAVENKKRQISDGIENDFIEFTSGTRALLTVAEKKRHLVT